MGTCVARISTAVAVRLASEGDLAAVGRVGVAVGGAGLALIDRALAHDALSPDTLLGCARAQPESVANIAVGTWVDVVASTPRRLGVELAHPVDTRALLQETRRVFNDAVCRSRANPKVRGKAGVFVAFALGAPSQEAAGRAPRRRRTIGPPRTCRSLPCVSKAEAGRHAALHGVAASTAKQRERTQPAAPPSVPLADHAPRIPGPSGTAPASAAPQWYRCGVVRGLYSYVSAAIALLLVGCAGGDTSKQGSSSFGGSSPTGTPATPATTDSGLDDTDPLDTSGGQGGTGESGVGPGSTGDPTSGEAVCGDGVAQGTESCDGKDLGTMTCGDFGFAQGTLICDAQCNLVTDGCRSCGDGMLAASELCDGNSLGGETCQSQGFGGGTLLCDAECAGYDTSACTALPTCGDGILNGGEACDGNQLGGATCASIGFDVGVLSCTASCTHNTSQCEFLNCGGQGDICLFDEMNPQGTCCPAGVGGNVLGICALLVCQ